ncbi:WD40 repeat-like protein [Gonapodya prolifera JEL478]|uniref:WD40 repeat-like protein n=1 Tax=Gonapodya prolifera (strain JEL478) TaxID=1344416 RepID=A0A139AR04_GONPJ|nr:WD40 repeat-like protein [Gonapodya prolifera JEL478]|eukprot:KXS19187.1 WD40 repeat-like protein [Gonapodya prolifera JEL478]
MDSGYPLLQNARNPPNPPSQPPVPVSHAVPASAPRNINTLAPASPRTSGRPPPTVGSFPGHELTHDIQFLTKPSTSLYCPICHDLLTDPVITSQCNHSFCAACIQRALEVDSTCPLCRCRTRNDDLHPNLALAGLILELPVYCPHRRLGCTEVVRLESLRSHSVGCGFRPAQCVNRIWGCEFQGTLSEANNHLHQCPFEKIKPYIEQSERRFRELEARVLELERERKAWVDADKGKPTQLSPRQESPVVANGDSFHGQNGSSSGEERENFSTWPQGDIQCRRTISDHRAGVTSLAYTPGVLYSGAYDGTTKVFDAESGALIRSFRGHRMSVWALAVEQGAERFFSAGSDGTIKVWDMSDGEIHVEDGWEEGAAAAMSASAMEGVGEGCVRTLREHEGKVYSLVVMEDRLYSASSDKTIKVWNLRDLTCIATLSGHTDGVNSLIPLGRDRIASAASDKTVRVWDLATSRVIHTLDDSDSEILSVAWSGSSQGSPNGMLFASTYDANIVAYAGDQGYRKIGTMQGHNWEVWQLQYSMGVLFSGSFDHTIKRWDPRMFQCTHTLRGHKGFVHALALGNDNLISGCADRTVKIWR